MTAWNFNQNWIGSARPFIVGGQLFAEDANLDTDDRVGAGIEGIATLEYSGAERVLLKTAGIAFQRLIDQVSQQAALYR